jgi:hypothetical protein
VVIYSSVRNARLGRQKEKSSPYIAVKHRHSHIVTSALGRITLLYTKYEYYPVLPSAKTVHNRKVLKSSDRRDGREKFYKHPSLFLTL